MFENGPIPPEAMDREAAADCEASLIKTWAVTRILDDRPMPADGFREQDTFGPGPLGCNPKWKPVYQGQMAIGSDGWSFTFMNGELVGICAPGGRRFVPEDLEAKAQAFREDMIERVTRKEPTLTAGIAMTTDAQMPELLPCPFCGEKPRFYPAQVMIKGDCPESIVCDSKNCPMLPATEYLPIAQAIAAWNTRAANAAADLGASGQVRALAELRAAHADWSQRQFGDVSAIGPAKHLSKEALEVATAPHDPIEHADCWMLLWDMQRRAGISDEMLAEAIQQKLAINMDRSWPAPQEGEAREHLRADMTAALTPAPQPAGEAVPVAMWDAIAPALNFPADWREQSGGSLSKQKTWANGFQTCREQVSVRIGELEGYTHPPQPSVSVAEAALKMAGDYLEACKVNGLPDLGDASRMPFIDDVILAVDAALRALKGGDANG